MVLFLLITCVCTCISLNKKLHAHTSHIFLTFWPFKFCDSAIHLWHLHLLWRVEVKTTWESQKAALRTSHRLLRCRVVFTKRCHYNYYCHYCHYYYYHNLSFWVMSQFAFSNFAKQNLRLVNFFSSFFLSLVPFCHNLIRILVTRF